MDTKVNYTIVGIFIIVLLSAIALSIIWLSSGFSLEGNSTYLIYMQESVGGLNIDSNVEYNGLRVGAVKKIRLNEKNPRLVEIEIDILKSTPITKGTEATLNTRGLTGLTYLALIDKGQDLSPLTKQPGQAYPVIKTSPSIFLRLETALSEMSKSFRGISDSIQQMLDKENQQSIKKILINLQSVTANLSANNQKLNLIIENTVKASQQFAPLMRSSTSAMQILETQTLPTAYQLISNLDRMTNEFSEVAVEIKQNPSILIRGVERQGLGPGETK